MNKWMLATGVVALVCTGLVAVAEPGQGWRGMGRGEGPGLGRGGQPMGRQQGQGPRMGQGRGQGFGRGMGQAWLEQAGLTEEQTKALQTARYAHQKAMIDLRSGAERAELDLERLLQQDAPDREAVMKAVEAVGQARTELQKAQVAQQLQTREILGKEGMEKIRSGLRQRGRDGRDQ